MKNQILRIENWKSETREIKIYTKTKYNRKNSEIYIYVALKECSLLAFVEYCVVLYIYYMYLRYKIKVKLF